MDETTLDIELNWSLQDLKKIVQFMQETKMQVLEFLCDVSLFFKVGGRRGRTGRGGGRGTGKGEVEEEEEEREKEEEERLKEEEIHTALRILY